MHNGSDAGGNRDDRSTSEQNEELIRFGVSMPASLVRELDAWRTKHGYASRSEAMRDLLRDKMVSSQWEEGEADDTERVGVVTLVYKHTTRELSDHLTEMQHHHHTVAQAALHIHLTPENCLEVIVLRGKQDEVSMLAHHLMSARGVLHGKFIPTTTGEDIS
ncbi:MAG TPA: nickel-responsive transcriptional regulator NikR [Chthonomonadaceae bacterium]|nr:nickel-responsive transcriptional regulator NikR [Chthonomonadaceae bacterium]